MRGRAVPEHVSLVVDLREAQTLKHVLRDTLTTEAFTLNEWEEEVVQKLIDIFDGDDVRKLITRS